MIFNTMIKLVAQDSDYILYLDLLYAPNEQSKFIFKKLYKYL